MRRQVFLEALGHEVEEVLLVERAPDSTLGRRAVVAHQHHDRVVELTQLGDEVEETGHLRVVWVRKPANTSIIRAVQASLIGVQGIPGRHPRGSLGQIGARGEQAGGEVSREDLSRTGPTPGRTARDSGR